MAMSTAQLLDHSTRVLSFKEDLAKLAVIIDVRSEKEFVAGSVPGSVNIPIFDDEERKLVGTIYRHGGQDKAIDTGFDLVTARLQEFLENFAPWQGGEVGILCARGGMRSRSVTNLLNEHGFTAWQLAGGYKEYRKLVVARLESFQPRLIVLHGLTGTGKTRLLQHLDHAIDLEDLAQHQSSLFGGLNRQPRSQKNFDSQLFNLIDELVEPPWFIEGESRKMGNIYLPKGLAEAMDRGQLVYVTSSLENRIARIVADYPVENVETMEAVRTILHKLSRHLGSKTVQTLCELLEKGELHELVRILLVEYYDKRYNNNLETYSYSLQVNSDDIHAAAALLEDFREHCLVSST